jgi:hypothetical protein
MEEVKQIYWGFPERHGEPIACGCGGAVTLVIYETARGGNVDFGDWVGNGDGGGEIPMGSRRRWWPWLVSLREPS